MRAALGAAAVLALCGALAGGCAPGRAVRNGTGGIVEQARAMPYFDAIEVAGVYDVDVIAGSTPDVTVHADASLLPYIETVIHGRTLSIRTRRGVALRPTRIPHLTVFTWRVSRITVAGATTFHAHGLAGDVLLVRITGAGRGTLAGAVRALRVLVTGAAALDALALDAQTAEVTIAGVGDVALRARDRLDVDVSGAGRVRYAGRPGRLAQHLTGNGEVEPLP